MTMVETGTRRPAGRRDVRLADADAMEPPDRSVASGCVFSKRPDAARVTKLRTIGRYFRIGQDDLCHKSDGNGLANIRQGEGLGDDVDDLAGQIVRPFALFGVTRHQKDLQRRKGG